MSPSKSNEPLRWTIAGWGLTANGGAVSGEGPALPPGEQIEVMPVSEHEKWREAFNDGWKRDMAVNARLRAALERISTGKRPDGTYNLGREACEQIARKALEEDA